MVEELSSLSLFFPLFINLSLVIKRSWKKRYGYLPSFVMVSQPLLTSNSTRINCTACAKIWVSYNAKKKFIAREIIKKISRYRLYLFEILYITRWNFLLLRNDFFSFLFFFYIRIDNCVIKNRNQDFPLDIFQSVHVSLEILEEKRRNKKKRYERMKEEKFTRCGIIPGRRASTESLL